MAKEFNVCIVDDSRFIRDRLSRKLQERVSQVHIRTAENLADTEESLRSFDPDVIIVDIHLRRDSGFDVLRVIQERKMEALVIVLTNYALAPYKKKAKELGADYFFDKSDEFHRAIEVIEERSRPC